MKLKTLLEGFTPQLFHGTSIFNAEDIIKRSTFELSDADDSAATYTKEEKKKYPYYMSFARSMNSGFIKEMVNSEGLVVFEMDGKKLSERFRGKPIDYYQISHQEKIDRSTVKTRNDQYFDAEEFFRYFEHEDRLYSKKSTIKDIGKYIKAVHIEPPRNKTAKEEVEKLRKIKRNYPIYLYKTIPDFLNRRFNKAEKIWKQDYY